MLAVPALLLLLTGFQTGMQAAGRRAISPESVFRVVVTRQQDAQASGSSAAAISNLIEQGKRYYRMGRFGPALQKFEAVIKLDPNHDEALGLGAITAFRLDKQARARELFQRRATLPQQKDSIKAFCYYWSGLTRWREAHDLIASRGTLKQGKVDYSLSERETGIAREHIARGLTDIEQAISLQREYPEASNIRNLLHTESALIAENEATADEHYKLALAALRNAAAGLQLVSQNGGSQTADFGTPTVRVGEYSENADDDALLNDLLLLKLEGGRPVSREYAVIPPLRRSASQREPNAPTSGGVTSEGGAVSVGPGRGALYGQLVPGPVKVEILVATDGKVVFAQQLSGRPEIGGLAAAAARKWVFKPATFEGRPVQISAVITFLVTSKRKPTTPPSSASKN